MYTSMLLLALVGFPKVADGLEASVWHTDYYQARNLAKTEGKPLAVFVAPGKDAWSKLARTGKLGKESERTLTENYVRVFIDSKTVQGKKLAADLGLETGLGIVISDRTGDLMAFYHEGNLANAALGSYLHRFADPNRVVSTTETNPTQRTSYYPPQQPVQQQFNFGGFGGGRGGC